ncbi:MAG TPA: adenylyl-sulfate kinase [Methylotenera sp.]|nr:adenylyl-sulfate kinase [Methylotenera sp.]
MENSKNNIVWHKPTVSRQMRETCNNHPSFVLWFTGLSGAGKSTLAHYIEQLLHERACRTFVLDGDNVRHGLCSDLGFSIEDRHENIRRIGETSKLLVEAGIITISAFISPLRVDRDKVRALVAPGDFIEIYCDAKLEVCESRDVKGLYKKARAGIIKDFTGLSSPYETPLNPELIVQTDEMSLEDCAKEVLDYLESIGKIKSELEF